MEKNHDLLQSIGESKGEERKETLPSRVELHGYKYKPWWFLLPKQTETEDGEKKRQVSVPFILLIIILILPTAVALTVKQGTQTEVIPTTSGPGEEVSIETDEVVVVETGTPVHKEPEEKAIVKEDREEEKIKKEEKEERNHAKEKKEEKVNKQPISPPVKEKIKEEKETKEEKQQMKEQANPNETTYHTVQPGETLFRIAMNYYQSSDGVEKIRQANGLSGNDISSGQRLKIPRP